MINLITIQQAVDEFKDLLETSIVEGGIKAKEAIIRSSRPINFIHEAVKSDLISNGISPDRIHPPLGESKPELKLAEFIKKKSQDVCVTPVEQSPKNEELSRGILKETSDYYGQDFTERIISINVRSQMSSLAKNFDTLYERTIAEAMNLHIRCPKMVLGEVYMIPVKEYNAKVMNENLVQFYNKVGAVEKYIKSFQAINGRHNYKKDEYKYERVCLLLVDFEQTPCKIYSTNQELIKDGLLDIHSTANINELSWETFTNSLLSTYNERF